ncbi:MAG TPA: VWA domain-containing protein [Pyrinomonadaceae bacterium]
MKSLLSIILLGLVALSPIALGQGTPSTTTPSQQDTDDVIRINTELVQTDVMVFDKSGRFVDNLPREQFEVRVDGKPVPVSFFERVVAGSTREAALEAAAARGAALPEKSATAATAPAALSDRGRTIVFFLDDLHLSADSVQRTRQSILRFIDNEMGANDQIAISSASGQIGFLQQFTDNRSVLRLAVSRINYRPYAVHDGENIPMTEYTALKIDQGDRDATDYYVTQMLQATNTGSAGGGLGAPGSPFGGSASKGRTSGLTRESAEKVVKERAQVLLKQASAITVGTLSSLESLMRSSSQLSGRKLVFFISDGFYLNDRNTGFGDKLKRITDAAVRAGVVVYSLDARGLISQTDASSNRADPMGRLARSNTGEVSASQDPLTAVASDTGGRALLNSGALDQIVGDALKETSNYYLLAWRPADDQRAGKFKRVEVSIAGRPELTVRLPRGYLDADARTLNASAEAKAAKPEAGATNAAGQPAEAAKTADAELRAALGSFASRRSVPTHLNVSYLDAPGSGALLTASVQVSTLGLSYGADNKQPAAVDLAGVVLNDQGKSVNGFKTRLNVNPLPAGVTQTDEASVIYNYKAPLPPGLYQVRAAARDEKSGLLGSSQQWIEIPDLANRKLTLSSLLVGGKVFDKGAKKEGAAGNAAAAAPSSAPQVQFSVDKRFARSSRLSFWVFIYNAARNAAAPPDVTAQVQVFRGAEAVVTTQPRKLTTEGMSDLARIPYGGEFALSSLAPGRYILKVTITDRVANTSVAQRSFFEVE